MPDHDRHDHRHDRHAPAPWEPGVRLLAITVIVAAVLGIEAVHLSRRQGPPRLAFPAPPPSETAGPPLTTGGPKTAGRPTVSRAAPGDRIDNGLVLTFSMLDAAGAVIKDS